MSYVKVVVLSDEARRELEKHHRNNGNGAVRKRCHMVLLKSKGRSAEDIADILECSMSTVHGWVKRYQREGFAGLTTKEGRGRKPLLTK